MEDSEDGETRSPCATCQLSLSGLRIGVGVFAGLFVLVRNAVWFSAVPVPDVALISSVGHTL